MATEYRNSIRSRKAIRSAFSALIAEKKSIEKITVKEIVEKADISKSTFYCHYDDIPGLVKEFEDEVLTTVQNQLDEFKRNPSLDLHDYLKSVINTIKENDKDYRMLLSGIYPTNLIFRVKTLVIETLRNDLNFKTKNTDPELRYAEISFFAIGFIDLVVGYFQGYGSMSLDEVVKFTSEIIDDYINS